MLGVSQSDSQRNDESRRKVKQRSLLKGKGMDTCYSATYAYMSQTRDQQRFTISEVVGMSQWCRSVLDGRWQEFQVFAAATWNARFAKRRPACGWDEQS